MTTEGGPLGLYVEDGKTRTRILKGEGGGNFFLKPNGVFSVDRDGAVHVETTEAYLARKSKPVWATQSGPMLVIDGALHPKFQPDGESRQIRNGVGRLNDRTALFVISDTPVSFGKFARFFRDALHCQDALFFDGSISSLWAPALRRQDHAAPMGPMVVVLDRKGERRDSAAQRASQAPSLREPAMKLALNILGGLMIVMGVIWILQGTNVVAGVPLISRSFMMGKTMWVGNGAPGWCCSGRDPAGLEQPDGQGGSRLPTARRTAATAPRRPRSYSRWPRRTRARRRCRRGPSAAVWAYPGR